MSDTPRTDAARISAWGESGIENSIGFSAIPVEFARQLERELAEAQAEITRLKGEAESWEKVFDRTCEHLAEAKTEIAAMKEGEK